MQCYTDRVEELYGLVLVDGQEAFLTGRDRLETVCEYREGYDVADDVHEQRRKLS